VAGFDPAGVSGTLNRWIVARAADTAARVGAAIEAYRFNEAAQTLYQFTWNTFCDWYLEFAKPVFNGDDAAAAAETRATAAWVLDLILIVMHPVMPYVTEELWGSLADTRESPLIAARWPDLPDLAAPDAEAEMDWLVGLITAIRSVRAEMNVPPAARLSIQVKDAAGTTRARLETHRALVGTLARVDAIDHVSDAPASGAAQIVVDEATVILPLADVIDLDAERARLSRDVAKQEGDIAKLAKKLSNEGFLAKAPAEVVAENRERLADLEATRDRLKEALARIG
jgi:valyl-tRNA synthetase